MEVVYDQREALHAVREGLEARSTLLGLPEVEPDPRGMWMQTHSGQRFYPADPLPSQIDIRDIAEGLSKECRYNGQCKGFYSVAEHSILVASVLPNHLKLQGLMHDATEAYLKDIPRPLKVLLPGYRALEEQLWTVIAERFNLDPVMHPLVKQADDAVLLAEKEQIMGRSAPWSIPGRPANVTIRRMDPDEARFEFMAAFMELTDARRHA